jgi:hypothetical protein
MRKGKEDTVAPASLSPLPFTLASRIAFTSA